MKVFSIRCIAALKRGLSAIIMLHYTALYRANKTTIDRPPTGIRS